MEIDIQEFNRDFPYEIGSDLKFIEKVDCGAFGTVLHVFDKKMNKDIAVKVISKIKRSPSYINKVKEEISILKKLHHPNIVKFYGFLEANSQLLIKMEYIKYGTLKNWIIQNKDKISDDDASTIIRNILSAIEYLHYKQICHRDLKPENIMLARENDLNSIKIIDFGLSTQNLNKLINNDYCGTYIYMAPELIEKKLYFISVDIWSIGILMYMLLNKGKHPFYIKGDRREKIAEKIKNVKLKFYEKITPLAKHLILKLLEPNPSWRYTASQAKRHPWITRNFNDIPPVTFNESLIKSNNKNILKDLFLTCLFFNYFKKKENLEFLTHRNCKKKFFDDNSDDEEEKNANNDDNDILKFKLKEKHLNIKSRNKVFVNQNYKKYPSEKIYPYSQIDKNKNIFILLQKIRSKKIKSNIKLKRLNSISSKDSKPHIRKNIKLIKSIEKKRSNSIDMILYTPIKQHDFSINSYKINEECKNKISNIFKKNNNNIFHHLSDKKIRANLPKLHIKFPFKNSSMTLNNNENSNSSLTPIILPSLSSTKQKYQF